MVQLKEDTNMVFKKTTRLFLPVANQQRTKDADSEDMDIKD